ncbi:MAG: hypothetical protein NTV99_12380, partial [Deltaproteobacteria bacterium]|nr:hypothetical protein [Deltaproteobacteria bacterium]
MNTKLLIKAVAVIVLILSLPLCAAGQSIYHDPGDKVYKYYFRGELSLQNIVPVYVYNFTPYEIHLNEEMMKNWYMPKTIPPKSMAMGFSNYWIIVYAKRPFGGKPIPFDVNYTYSIRDEKGEPYPRFAIHLQNINTDVSPPPKTGFGSYLKMGSSALGLLGMIPEIGIAFRTARFIFNATYFVINHMPVAETNWYMSSYPLTSLKTKECTPAFTWYCDYCFDPDYNSKCTDKDKTTCTASFDSFFAHTDPETCQENNTPDRSSGYVIGAAGYAGAYPFMNYPDGEGVQSQDSSPKPLPVGYPTYGYYGQHFSVSVWRYADYHAIDILMKVRPLQEQGVAAQNAKLQ